MGLPVLSYASCPMNGARREVRKLKNSEKKFEKT
jgi:hypothetical protein